MPLPILLLFLSQRRLPPSSPSSMPGIKAHTGHLPLSLPPCHWAVHSYGPDPLSSHCDVKRTHQPWLHPEIEFWVNISERQEMIRTNTSYGSTLGKKWPLGLSEDFEEMKFSAFWTPGCCGLSQLPSRKPLCQVTLVKVTFCWVLMEQKNNWITTVIQHSINHPGLVKSSPFNVPGTCSHSASPSLFQAGLLFHPSCCCSFLSSFWAQPILLPYFSCVPGWSSQNKYLTMLLLCFESPIGPHCP